MASRGPSATAETRIYLWMYGKVNGPPLRRSRLFLVTQQLVVGAAEVVAGHAVADSPASRPIHVILDNESLRIPALFAAARNVALQTPQ